MTNGWIDIKNTDMMLIMGGNPAENHPCGFKWAIEAKRQRNAKMIVVDPRFTRTAAVADLFLQIRAGTDIAFLGGMIHYALENGRVAREYLVNFTNAAFVVREGFKLPEDGLYSGFDDAKGTYDRSTWNYESAGGHPPDPAAPAAMPADVATDFNLEHPRCVYQLLKQQYSKYTPEMVERITGIPKDQFLKAADLLTSIRKDGDTKKAGTVIYAVGWTQHSFGTQIIRAAAILQLIMGNVGRAGGGVNALRGHSNIQGATDVAGIFDNLPGYLKVPNPTDKDFDAWMTRITPKASKPHEWDSFNYWSNTPKFAVSLLKAMYGDAATKENGWAFDYLPKVDREYSWAHIWDDMYRGKLKGVIAFGMNSVAIGPNSEQEHRRAEEGRLAGGLRYLSRRNQRFLEIPRHYPRGDEEHQDGSLSPAGRRVRRKGRHFRQFRALAAMEVGGGSASRRGEARSGNSRAHLPESSRTLSQRRRRVPGSDSQSDIGTTRSRRILRWPKSRKNSTAALSPMFG